MTKLNELRKHLKPGGVYRRDELARWSTNVDRHIKELLTTEELVRLSAGLYLHPKQTAFGKAPADDASLVAAFLKDKIFLITSPNAYNALGVGATQLYNETVVYNRKRHGRFTLGGRSFDFRRKQFVPKKLTEEFLLVDLVNNLKQVAEDEQLLLTRVKEKTAKLDRKVLRHIAHEFGTVRARKFFDAVTTVATHHAP
ncbi:DUF6088 family protein [Pseudochelatococcus sp. G4_1912]|uniref:DUF6088 family protein n=1 Tax=Pseudochelatococcus sp. G4_1912 TaxID=3114288 RepID=UPI0039C67469